MRFIIVALMVLLFQGTAVAQGLTRVMSGYAAISGPHAVLWVARDTGLFEKNGLRTEVAYIRSGSTMAQTLVSGEIQMAQMGGPAALAAGVAGMDVSFVAVALNTTPIVIMGTVSRMEDLKGKAIGVTRYGSNTDISARFAIRKAGLQPEKDVALIQLEDYSGIMGGFSPAGSPRVHWRIRLPTTAKKLGYKEIADIAALGLEFPFVGIVAKKSYIKDNLRHRATVRPSLHRGDRALQKQSRTGDESHQQIHWHQGSRDSRRNGRFLYSQVGAGALSNDRRNALRARTDRDTRSEGQKRQSGIIHGCALRQAAGR